MDEKIKKSHKSQILIFCGVIVAIIGFGLFLFKDRIYTGSTIGAVAEIKSFENNVTYKKSGDLTWLKAQTAAPLFEQDSLSTQEKSQALFEYKNGYAMKIEENSLIVIDPIQKNDAGEEEYSMKLMKGVVQVKGQNKTGKRLVIKTPKSEIKVDNAESSLGIRVNNDKSEDVWITSGKAEVVTDGKIEELNQGDHKAFNQKIKVIEDTPEIVEFGTSDTGTAAKKLSTRQISEVVKRYQKNIRLCYAKSARSVQSKGEVTIAFTIQNTGEVSSLSIKQSSINDPDLHQCIQFWIGQARFPAFSGNSQRTEQTLLFE